MAITYLSGGRIQGVLEQITSKVWKSTTGNDGIQLDTDAIITGDFTVGFWAYRTATDTMCMFATNAAGDGNGNITIKWHVNTNYALWLVYNGSNHIKLTSDNYHSLANTWKHITVKGENVSGTMNLTFYVDGVSKGTTTSSATTRTDTNLKTLGNEPNADEGVQGYIDDFFLFNRALSTAEVLSIADGSKKPDHSTLNTSSSLRCYLPLDIDYQDVSGQGNHGTESSVGSLAGNGVLSTDTDRGGVAVSTDEKATITNVPVGTRFEETDTRKIFRRKSSLTSFDDLLTDKGWVTNTTGTPTDFAYNAANDSVHLSTIRRTPTHQQIYLDLQDADYLNGSNLSDTAWLMRLGKIEHNAFPSGGGVTLNFMISKGLQDSGTNQYSINLQGHFPSNDLFWRLRANSNTNNEGNSTHVISFPSAFDPSLSTSYLWEFKRDGNNFSAIAYAESDTSYASPLENGTVTVTASGITALRYILITNDSEGENNSYTADMECFIGGIKIYNGTTTADDVWTEKGTA